MMPGIRYKSSWKVKVKGGHKKQKNKHKTKTVAGLPRAYNVVYRVYRSGKSTYDTAVVQH